MEKTIALTLVCLALLASFACGSESQEDISLEVAKEWTDDSIENVSECRPTGCGGVFHSGPSGR